MAELVEISPGLWRWTARHPAAVDDPVPDSPDDWEPEVGCVAYAVPSAFVLVDPLVPDAMWPELDAAIERHGERVHVMTTLRPHSRSRDEVVARYGACADDAALPDAVVPVPIQGAAETMAWLPDERTLIPGDRLLGAPDGSLRMCPESWLYRLPGTRTQAQLAARLRPLLDLPIERVLVSHGEPVLAGGHAALAAALGPG